MVLIGLNTGIHQLNSIDLFGLRFSYNKINNIARFVFFLFVYCWLVRFAQLPGKIENKVHNENNFVAFKKFM